MSILNTTNTPIGISFATASPSKSDNISAGYPISQEWFNKKTGERFYHKADGVWVSYASTDAIGEAPVMFVDVATTAQFDGSYNNGVGGVGATLTRSTNGTLDVDNVSLNLGVVVLVKDQPVGDFDDQFGSPNLQYQNGVYIVTRAGTPTLSVILTRADFADESDELYPSQVNVLDGSVNQNKFFLQESENPMVGTASIVYTTNLIPPTPQVVLPVVFVDTATTEPLPSCTYANIYDPVIPGNWWRNPSPIDATITANANGPLGAINGVTMSNSFFNRNNRILVKNQANPVHNGDYQIVNAGSSTTPWKLQRITKSGSSMVRSSREWKVNNETSTLYGNRYNLINSIGALKVGVGGASLEFSEISSSLGLIRIVDLLGEKFTDLTTARAYVKTFTSAVISDESFNDGVYYFTVPLGSNFDLTVNFLNNTSAHILDEYGLIDSFGDSAFLGNTGNNVLGNCTFGTEAFRNSEGNNALGDCTFTSYALFQSIGNNVLGDCIFTSKALASSSGDNILGNCTFTTDAFRLATGNNILGDCTFGNTAFYLAPGNNKMGLCSFGTDAFVGSNGDNILGNCTFVDNAFQGVTGNNILGNCTFGDLAFYGTTGINRFRNILLSTSTFNFASNSLGRFEIYGNIGTDETANYPNFFPSSTAVIWAHKSKETSNSGQLEGDLATARTNGAKLFFGYEKPQISEVLVTGLLTGGGTSSSITIGTDPTIATGSGVFGYVPYWNSAQNLSSTSSIYNVGTNVGISNFSPTHPLTIGSSVSGIGGQISLQGRTSGNVVIKTSDVTSSWTASLPTTKGSITPFVYSNFGGEIMLNDGNGNLFFGTTPSLSLSENTVFIGNTYGYAKSRTLMGDIYSDYTGTITINNGVVSYQKMQTVSQAALLGSTVAGGVVTEIPFFDYLIPSGGAIATNLENPSNWSAGAYIGTGITGTYQGQSHYDSTYFFTAVEDNNWIRILRS
jgi:hypothetical protein